MKTKKIKEITQEEKREYHRNKKKEWLSKNKEKNIEYNKKWREENKVHKKEYSKKYNKDNREKVNKYSRERYRKNPWKNNQSSKYIREYMKEYLKNKENHEKALKRLRDYINIRNKLIEKLGGCQACGKKNNLELHHEDYSEGGKVIILCRKCHRHIHRIK